MSVPLVSIIIPAYNRGGLLEETLESIIKQTYINWECLIIDDGSSDNTVQLAEEYVLLDARFRFYKRPTERIKGANACRNFGFEMSKGEFINWFDSDDIMMPEKIKSQVSRLINSSLDFIVCQTLVFEENPENIIGLRKENIYSSDFFNDFVTDDIKWLTQAPIFKRKFIINNNLKFDENLSQSQERDFFINILGLVDDYLFDNTPLVLLRKHPESISFSRLTETKIRSNFIVNYRILKNHKGRLTSRSILYLQKKLKFALMLSIRFSYLELSKDLMKLMNDEIVRLRFSDQVKIFLGSITLKRFGKGEVFFK